MNDATYYQTIANLLASLQVPVQDTAQMRIMADLMDETIARGKAAIEAPANDEP